MKKLCVEKFICLSNDDSYGQISSLNRVPVRSHLFLYVRRLSREGKNNTTLRHFCYAELKITGFHCSCMSVTYINNFLFFFVSGLCALSVNSDNCYLAYPGSNQVKFRFSELPTVGPSCKRPPSIKLPHSIRWLVTKVPK